MLKKGIIKKGQKINILGHGKGTIKLTDVNPMFLYGDKSSANMVQIWKI